MAFVGDSTKIISGPHDITINGVKLGHTEENIQLVQFTPGITEHNSHEAGPDVPVKMTQGPRGIRLEMRSIQIQANLLFQAFPEAASVTSDGLVTVGAASGAQDSLTVPSAVTIVLHPSDTAGTANDWTFNNMVYVAQPFDQAFGRESKAMLNMFFKRIWSDTSVAYIIGGNTNPS